MKILYHFPSRERPEKFFNAIDNIISMSRHEDYLILASLDLDDNSMTTLAVKERLDSYGPKLKAVFGTSLNKIHAVNRDIWTEDDWDILCTHSDDMIFIKEGFDLDILEAFKDWNGYVHFPDQVAKDRLCTYPMMHRDYYNIFGYVYYPSYFSVYADNEQFRVAILLNKYKYVPIRILEHRHHMWGFGPADDLLKRTENPINYAIDGQLFTARERINFEVEKYMK